MAGFRRYGSKNSTTVADEIVQAARVVQELADRDALGERRGVPVEVEQPLRDELKDERRHEDLRHAPDAEAVIDRERLARPQVREAGRCFNSPVRPASGDDRARNTGRDNRLQLIRDRLHLVGGQRNVRRRRQENCV